MVARHHRTGDDWGVLPGFMCDRACCHNSMVAETRFSRLVNATPRLVNVAPRPPGRLFIGGANDAVQRAGQHCDLNMDSQ